MIILVCPALFLVVEKKSTTDRQKVFLASGCRITLGQDEFNHIVVNSSQVSKIHASFLCSDGQFWIEPLGAQHGD